jgi:hypothetical protein
MTFTSYQETKLWKKAFDESRADSGPDEQKFFQTQYQLLRDKASMLVASIEADIPGLTVHDVTHLDALWDMASLLAGKSVDLNPTEAFVFGASILLHDAGMSLAAYPNRVADLRSTTIWKDLAALPGDKGGNQLDEKELISLVLRKLHAQKAGDLPTQPFFLDNGEKLFLIDEVDLRRFYGRSIGLLAFSHWWPIDRVESEFLVPLGAFPPYTRCSVDRLPKSLFDIVFKQSKKILIISQHDGRIRTVRVRSMISYDYRTTDYLVQKWFIDALQKLWKNVDEEEDPATVGTVNGTEVVRSVMRFMRT